MKKISIQIAVAISIAAFIAGIIAGLVFSGFPPTKDKAAGTIGKVSNYRNVSVTENDIKLRNELLNDTAQRNALEKYLMFNYAFSVETTNDIGRVLELTTAVPEFTKNNQHFITSLENYNRMLEQSRLDIFSTLDKLSTLKSDTEEPVIYYLNVAFDGMSRLHNNNNVLISYANAIGKFLIQDPKTSFSTLKEAHDILLMNVSKSAVITNNEPVIKYLADMKMLTEKEDKAEVNLGVLTNQFQKVMNKDMETLQLASSLRGAFLNEFNTAMSQSQKLEGIITLDGPVINDRSSLGVINSEQLMIVVFSIEKLSNETLYNTGL